jgi:two-component system nitrogen regulation sensor histidine kinase NtrY
VNTSLKIHIILALAALGLFLTALIAQNTYSPQRNLARSGKNFQQKLQEKENIVQNILSNQKLFNQLKSLEYEDATALNLIQSLSQEKNISFVTYKKNKAIFWSSNLIVPDSSITYKEGRALVKEANGYYEVIKKTENDFSVLFFIPIKNLFPYTNQYLRNDIARDLSKNTSIDIVKINSKNAYNIKSIDQHSLFAIKIDYQKSNFFSLISLILWASALILFCILIQRICILIADKGHAFLSIILLAAFILIIRYINLYHHWPDVSGNLKIFNPSAFAASKIFPSLGDFVVNMLFLTWFCIYLYNYRFKILKPVINKALSYVIWGVCITILILISLSLLSLFKSLIIDSRINFDITYVSDFEPFIITGAFLLCLSFLCFFIFCETFLALSLSLNIYQRHKLLMFLSGLIIATVIFSLSGNFTIFFLLWGCIVILLGYNNFYKEGKLTPQLIISIILIAATICAIQLFEYQDIKEKEIRKVRLQQLESPDDPNAIAVFNSIEHKIIQDSSVVNFYLDTLSGSGYLSNQLQKLYFDIQLSAYEFKIYAYNKDEKKLFGDNSYDLNTFKSLVIYGSFKVSDYFYRVNDAFGIQYYFGMLPIRHNGKYLGVIVIEFKSKPRERRSYFPELLIAAPRKLENELKDYSYAFYVDNKLVLQSGKYVYNRVNNQFNGKLRDYNFMNTSAGLLSAGYNHLIYKPTDRKLLVVSKEDPNFFNRISLLSFFFTLLLIFTLFILAIRWLSQQHFNFRIRNLKWNLLLGNNRILYKTRIQISMVITVVFTLLIVGLITFISISNQYQDQQDKQIQSKIYQIAGAFDENLLTKGALKSSKESQLFFNTVANNYAVDLNLFDTTGNILLTNQPKLLDFGLVSKKMNAVAYLILHKLQKSKYVNEESIGNLHFKASYIPVFDAQRNIVAYLQLPYFSNKADYNAWVGEFINTMINVYAFVFVAIGIFAVFVANQITSPLTMIQQSLSNIQYGHRNEPIQWKRNDEIGSLIREYNNMIAALEDSASRLAQSERELAWREMAKQVAHEIKNPLTPLKLGLQLLEKSWKDQDPNFAQKFTKFSKSFIEQIESLSTIATEFSNFAKMPETHIEKVNLFDLISKSVDVFKQLGEVEIIYEPSTVDFNINADRDQMMRCFNNLLKNAVEAIPQGKNKQIKIDYKITHQEVNLSIQDNGSGIPENLQDKIFEPNFTTKSSGTGLGLAFVKNSIQNAGGKVWFITKKDIGTIFYISLPRSVV